MQYFNNQDTNYYTNKDKHVYRHSHICLKFVINHEDSIAREKMILIDIWMIQF